MSYRRQSGYGKEQVAALLPLPNLLSPSRQQNQVGRFPSSLGGLPTLHRLLPS
jgi:hypothetical protein